MTWFRSALLKYPRQHTPSGGIIALPTGIVGVEIAREVGKSISEEKVKDKENDRLNNIVCTHCNREKHRKDAEYCYHCGHQLNI